MQDSRILIDPLLIVQIEDRGQTVCIEGSVGIAGSIALYALRGLCVLRGPLYCMH